MKNFVFVFLFLLFINFTIPFACYRLSVFHNEGLHLPEKSENYEYVDSVQHNLVTLYDKSVSSVIQIPLTEYLANAAACEMPALYEEEAIKAQMIAIHSYYLYCKDNPDMTENGYVIVDSNNMKGYTHKNRLNGFWGTRYYDYYAKFERCAKAVQNEILTYDGKPALTPYFAVSCGKTASCEEMWGLNLDYLASVDSSFDGVSDNYIEIKTFSPSEMYTRLKSQFPSLKISEDSPENWFTDTTYYESGYTKYIHIGEDKIPGDQFRDALGLKSSCIMVFWEDDTFSVATKGYGHGVGMSQFGANRLSQQGRKYDDILAYYYPGAKLEKSNNAT